MIVIYGSVIRAAAKEWQMHVCFLLHTVSMCAFVYTYMQTEYMKQSGVLLAVIISRTTDLDLSM